MSGQPGGGGVPILLIILIAILIAQIGFWDTLGAIFGALGVLLLFIAVLAGAVVLAITLAYRRLRRRF
jgi:uncharacterized membrane protein YkvI